MGLFDNSNSIVTTLEPRYDGNGGVSRQARAHGALTALTPYFLTGSKYGQQSRAIASGVSNCRVIVPLESVASGEVFWGQTGGRIAGVITANIDIDSGDGWNVTSGIVADSGTYTDAINEFAVALDDDDGSASTSHEMFLMDREIQTPT